MSFLYPFFLFLLPLSLLPLLLFMGLKGKKREILFSTLFLLRKKEFKEERIKQKYRLWLIIILRILMLITVILLMARPRYFGKKWRNAYFDASLSMKEGGKEVKKSLVKLLEIFGENRVRILNTHHGYLFLSDTSCVPGMRKNDVFYTDGKLPYKPNGKVICSACYGSDAWIYIDSIKADTLYFNINMPTGGYVKVGTLNGTLDSVRVSAGESQFKYILSGNKKYWWFFTEYKDNFMDNNFYFHIALDERIPVKLINPTGVLMAFFTSSPFERKDNINNCVSVDTISHVCHNQVVFYKREQRVNLLSANAIKVPFGKWFGYKVKSGDIHFLVFHFYPYDTASQFYDPVFLKALLDTLKDMFFEEGRYHKSTMFVRKLDFQNCSGPLFTDNSKVSGFYVCKHDTVAVNVDPREYKMPSKCNKMTRVTFQDLSSITFFKRLLVYFLIGLFILETLLVYII